MKKSGILKRIASMFYDLLIVCSILMLYTSLLVLLNSGLPIDSGCLAYSASLLMVTFMYFFMSWQRLGQTLGMRAWKIKIMDSSFSLPTRKMCAIRFITSIPSIGMFAIGIIWSYLPGKENTLHDDLSKTYIYELNDVDLNK